MGFGWLVLAEEDEEEEMPPAEQPLFDGEGRWVLG
jgi:hypothetical protein